MLILCFHIPAMVSFKCSNYCQNSSPCDQNLISGTVIHLHYGGWKSPWPVKVVKFFVKQPMSITKDLPIFVYKFHFGSKIAAETEICTSARKIIRRFHWYKSQLLLFMIGNCKIIYRTGENNNENDKYNDTTIMACDVNFKIQFQ